MGCYHYTCAASELSIGEGTPVVLTPLRACHGDPNDGAEQDYKIAFPPFKATYDDYGFVENIQSTPFHEAYARKLGFDSLASFAEMLGSRLNADEADLQQEGPAGEESEPFAERAPWSFALVREEAWRALAGLPIAFGYGRDERTAGELAMAGAREGAAALLAHHQSKAACPSQESELAQSKEFKYLFIASAVKKLLPANSAFSTFYARRIGHAHHGFFSGWATDELLAEELPARGSASDLEAALLSCGESAAVNYAMHMLRKTWRPIQASGPQTGEHAIHWLWAREVQAIAESLIDWTQEDNGLSGFEFAKSAREKDALSRSTPRPSDSRSHGRSI